MTAWTPARPSHGSQVAKRNESTSRALEGLLGAQQTGNGLEDCLAAEDPMAAVPKGAHSENLRAPIGGEE
jgi:hypothetical protein